MLQATLANQIQLAPVEPAPNTFFEVVVQSVQQAFEPPLAAPT